jgi:hypothetical protein
VARWTRSSYSLTMIRCAHRLLAGISFVVFASSGVRGQSAGLTRYLAIRDSFAKLVPKWPSQDKIDWETAFKADRLVRAKLDSLVRPIVGAFDVAGFVQPGRYNVETLLPGWEDSFLADGVLFQSPDSETRVFVSTPELIHRWSEKDAIQTIKNVDDLNHVFSTDAALTPYGIIPLQRPGVLLALLFHREQDDCPCDGNRIMLSLVRGRQLVVVDAPVQDVIEPPKTCVHTYWPGGKRYADTLAPRPTLTRADTIFAPYQFKDPGPMGYRACYAREIMRDPRWPRIAPATPIGASCSFRGSTSSQWKSQAMAHGTASRREVDPDRPLMGPNVTITTTVNPGVRSSFRMA